MKQILESFSVISRSPKKLPHIHIVVTARACPIEDFDETIGGSLFHAIAKILHSREFMPDMNMNNP